MKTYSYSRAKAELQWSALPLVLAAGFAARIAVGMSTDTVLMADEVYQYLEQAHRLVFGAGIVPWEYVYGMRSWLPALAIAGVLQACAFFGFEQPFVYQTATIVFLSAVSMALPLSCYRIAQAVFTENAARIALVFTCFWYEIVAQAGRATIDALAAYPLLGAMALLFVPRGRWAIAMVGLLAALTLLLRFQLAPAVAVLGLVGLWRWRLRAWPAALSFAVAAVAGGALDYYTWGVWFSSIYVNFQINLLYDVASSFGVHPVWYYLYLLLIASGGLFIPGVLGLALTWRKSWPLMATGGVLFLAFSAVAHKELRFIFVLTPLWLMGLAALLADRGRLLRVTLEAVFARVKALSAAIAPEVLAARLAPVALGSVLVLSGIGLFRELPKQYQVTPSYIGNDFFRDAYRAFALEPDVTGVIDLTGGAHFPLFWDLHHNVPLYYGSDWRIGGGFTEASRDPARYASHMLTKAGDPAPAGFRAYKTIGPLVAWRRTVDPPVTPRAVGYSRALTPPIKGHMPIMVKARW